jgi:hypothetical protein
MVGTGSAIDLVFNKKITMWIFFQPADELIAKD